MRNQPVPLVFRILERVIRFFQRWILPLLIQAAIYTFWSSLYALAAVWAGWRAASEMIADEGMKRAALAGLPSSLDPFLHPFFKVLAVGQLFWGWIFLAQFTTLLINALLRASTGHWINY